MLDLPAMMTTGDAARDLDTIRRYLVRLIPQLEMELAECRADSYGDALARRQNGMAAQRASGEAVTGAEALADHILDRNNPHGVTLAQLGFTTEKLTNVLFTETGVRLRLGGKTGLEFVTQTFAVKALADSWTREKAAYYQDIDVGEWEEKPALPVITIPLMTGSDAPCWLGQLTGSTRTQAGVIRVFCPAEQDVYDEDEGRWIYHDPPGDINLTITALGLGVYGYGESNVS